MKIAHFAFLNNISQILRNVIEKSVMRNEFEGIS